MSFKNLQIFLILLFCFLSCAASKKPDEAPPVVVEKSKAVQKRTVPIKKKASTIRPRKETVFSAAKRSNKLKKMVKPTHVPPALRAVEKIYKKAGTLAAKFSQIKTISSLKIDKESSGTIFIRRPNQVRWETLSPDPSLLVCDGKKFWFYTPPFDETEKGQVIIRKSSEIQSRLANALLAGSFSRLRGTTIKQTGPRVYDLNWKKGTGGDIQNATVTLDPKKALISEVALKHRGGNQSVIKLQDVRLGVKLPSQVFRFDPPPGTDEIRN